MWWRWLFQARTWLWLGIAFVVRGIFFWIFLHEHGLHGAWYGWGAENGDTPGYFAPIDQYLTGHAYLPDFRMPGYGLPYLLFRLFTTPQGAGTAILFAQFLLGAISVVVLARCARMLGAPTWAQHAVCILIACCARVAVYDVDWFPESFCTSALIFGVHGWLAHLRSDSRLALLWSGGWLAWAVFLKPVQAMWLVLLAVGILFIATGNARSRIARALLLLLPFLIADGIWMRRNWVMHRKLHPLSQGTIMPELANSHMYPVMRFMQAVGGNYIHWDPSADIRWFNMREGPRGAQGRRADEDLAMPAFALSKSITSDSLQLLADEMARWSDRTTLPEERFALTGVMRARCDRFINTYQRERPWQYQVMARARLTRLFFQRAGLRGVFGYPARTQAWWTHALDLFDAIQHWCVLIAGLFAAFWSLAKWKRIPRERVWLAVLVLTGVFVFPIALRLCEGRYLVPMYPWLLLMAITMLGHWRNAGNGSTDT